MTPTEILARLEKRIDELHSNHQTAAFTIETPPAVYFHELKVAIYETSLLQMELMIALHKETPEQ